MAINSASRQAYHFILDLIFPVLCVECGHDGSYLCKKCEFRITSLTTTQVCAVCAQPAVMGKTHSKCAADYAGSAVDGFIHSLRYKDPTAKKLVELFKYHGIRDIGAVAGKIMHNEILNQSMQAYFRDFILCPIPLHPKRLKWRGYNQAQVIAQHIAELSGMHTQSNALAKTRHSTAQAKLNKEQRIANAAGAFSATSIFTGKKFLIVDDVATTRATLNHAAAELKKAQAAEVWALTLAYED